MRAYSLSSTYHLIDESLNCKMLDFMDAHSGYNKVPIVREDEEKTSFITEMVTYYF